MTKAIGYCRTSPGTNDEGTSLDGQRRDVRTYCEENNIELVEIYEDEDVSGRKTKPWERDGGLAMMEQLTEDEEIDIIVARNKKRLSRQTNVQMSLGLLMKSHIGREVEIHTVVEGGPVGTGDFTESDDPMAAVQAQVIEMVESLLSEFEAAKTAADTRTALRDKQKRDEPVGRPTWGLTTNKDKYEDQDTATHFLPGDRFGDALEILATIEETGIDPLENGQDPSPHSIGKEYGVQTRTVRNIYRNRWKYKQAAEEDGTNWTVPDICHAEQRP